MSAIQESTATFCRWGVAALAAIALAGLPTPRLTAANDRRDVGAPPVGPIFPSERPGPLRSVQPVAAWPFLGEVEVEAGTTSLFAWSDSVVGALSPAAGEVRLLPPSPRASAPADGGVIRLQRKSAGRSGELYPDVMLRDSDGTLLWLFKQRGEVSRFSPAGNLVRAFQGESDAPFWMQATGDGVRLFATRTSGSFAGYERYSREGTPSAPDPGWLELGGMAGHGAEMFFFGVPERGTVEILAHLPYARIVRGNRSKTVDLLGCPEVPRAARENVRQIEAEVGLPSPLGRGVREGSYPASPFILAAAADGEDAVLYLVNGGVLGRLDVRAASVSCRQVPFSTLGGSLGREVNSSLAVAGDSVAILTIAPDSGRRIVRFWGLHAERPASTSAAKQARTAR